MSAERLPEQGAGTAVADHLLTALLIVVCLLAIGALLVVPAESKVVDLVYGAF